MFKSESYTKGIIYSTAFNILSKVIAFLNSIIIAHYFGTQFKTDLYFFTISTVTLFIAFFTGLNSSILIPESMRIKEQCNVNESQDFLNCFLLLYILIGITSMLVISLIPSNIYFAISNFDSELVKKNIIIIQLGSIFLCLTLINSYLMEILTSYKFFTIPTIASMLNNCLVLVFIFLWHKDLDILSILFGSIIACFVNLIFLIYLFKKYLNWKVHLKRIKIRSSIWRDIFYMQIGNITTTVSGFVPNYLLSGFNQGIITAFNYGRSVSEIPHQFLTMQVSSIIGIKFNELSASKKFKELNFLFKESTFSLIIFIFPISLIFYLYSTDIASLLFRRGKFDNNSVLNVALFLKYLSVLLPLYAINTLVSRIYMATQIMKKVFYYQVVANLSLIGFMFLGIKHFGAIGLVYALIFQYILNMLAGYINMKLFLPYMKYSGILISWLYSSGIFFFIVLISPYLKVSTDYQLVNLFIGSIVLFFTYFLLLGIAYRNSLFSLYKKFF